MDVLSFRTEIRRLIELRQEGEYWDFKKEWYQNKSDLFSIPLMSTLRSALMSSHKKGAFYCQTESFLNKQKKSGEPLISQGSPLPKGYAGDRNRTGTSIATRRILSPVRLPVPPRRLANGAYRARTYDPLLVRQMLSQLS